MNDEQQHRLALPQGTRIRDFEFHRVLGHGGFGMTYLGWNVTLDIPVAIKEYLPADLATRESDMSVVPQSSQTASDFQWGLERFLDEARTLARLQHPNIVRVHQYFEAHGTAYIAMDYVEGEDLSAYLARKGTLTEEELKAVLYPLLDALEVVHGADFLHRDIKPGNIVLRDVDGSPVLLDFGAARQAIGAKSRSVTSIVTPGYAPIEQYSSRGRQGAWTDIYALGGVCYRALTGQVPDDATDRMRQDPLVPVAQRCAGQASRGFLLAINMALSVDEGDRPQSVAAWRVALEVDAAETQKDEVGDATIVKRMEQDEPPSEPQKKPPFKRLAVVLVVVVLLVVGGKIYVDHTEQVALEKQRQGQVALEKQRQEQAALEKQRQEQAALEKQRQEQAALEKQRQEQAALEKQRQGQVALEKQRQEQAALEKQRQEEQAALEKQRREQTALEKQRREQAALEKQHPLEKQRQEQVFVSEVGRMPSPNGTDLLIAARLNLPVLTMYLLIQGADVEAKDYSGRTALQTAAWDNAAEVAEVLLNRGADANAKGKGLFDSTPLYRAASRNATEVAELLLNRGADVEAKNNYGDTPLHTAAYHNATEVAELLLNRGADANAKDNYGDTPLHSAASNAGYYSGTKEVAELLLNRGADVHAKGRHGWTPLHSAASSNASAMAELLLNRGADANAKDNKGLTPLHLAEAKNRTKVAEVLRRYGGRN